MNRLCASCGATFDGAICPYCGTRHVIESITDSVPVRDVMIDSTKTYNNEQIPALLNARYTTITTGRLTSCWLYFGVGQLTRHLYTRGIEARDFKYHLVIPPELYIQALVLIESEKIAGTPRNDKNVIGRFLDTVWIDPRIECISPACPWFLLVHLEALTDENFIDEHLDMFHSWGTTP